jgi:hypothetical protein
VHSTIVVAVLRQVTCYLYSVNRDSEITLIRD